MSSKLKMFNNIIVSNKFLFLDTRIYNIIIIFMDFLMILLNPYKWMDHHSNSSSTQEKKYRECKQL